MFGRRCNISLVIILVSLFTFQAFSQQINNYDSLAIYNSRKGILKPQIHYSLASTFMIIPHLGSVAGVTISPFLSIPLSPKLTVDGGIIAGRYSSFGNFNHEGGIGGEFNQLSVFGSASYNINSQLTLYGSGIRQITGTSPFYLMPKSSYSIGSSYKFGSFSVGVTLLMSKWNDNFSPFPFNDSQGFYSPYEQRTATFIPFGR
jgi:hypothetical protein